MKVFNAAVLVSALLPLASGHVMAEVGAKKRDWNQQVKDARPYIPPPAQQETNSGKWEGAVHLADEETVTTEKGTAKQQQMRLNLMGKRPQMEQAVD